MEFRYKYKIDKYTEHKLQAEVNMVPGCTGVCGDIDSIIFLYDKELTKEQQAKLAKIVSIHKVALPTIEEKMDKVQFGGRVLAALVMKNSTLWSSLTTAQQAIIQTTIDNAAKSVSGS